MPGLCQPVSMQLMDKTQDSIQSSTSMVHRGVENPTNGHMHIPAYSQISSSIRMPSKYSAEDCKSFHSKHSNGDSLMDSSLINGLSSTASTLLCGSRSVVADAHSSGSSMNSEVSNACMPNYHSEQSGNGDSHNSVEFPQYFHEGYCKVSEIDECRELADADSSCSPGGREKQEEDGDNDDVLGDVFAFSEEGIFRIIAVKFCTIPSFFYLRFSFIFHLFCLQISVELADWRLLNGRYTSRLNTLSSLVRFDIIGCFGTK